MKPTQLKAEFAWLCDIMRREKVRSYLEIGSKYGDSLLLAAMRLTVPSRFVSVDINARKSLAQTMTALAAMGHVSTFVHGDSTDEKTIEMVRSFGPYDCCFIDANHMSDYVQSDFDNYGPMARIVAFHDIGYRRDAGPINIGVPPVWAAIKTRYRYEELCLSPDNYGIGVVWMC